jgi:sec-independent protein translocase protein TatA
MIGDIFQPTHLLFILVVALLVLGPKRLPEAGRALGKGIRDFKTAVSGEDEHASEIVTQAQATNAATAQPTTQLVDQTEQAEQAETVQPIG